VEFKVNPVVKKEKSKLFRLIKASFGCIILFCLPGFYVTLVSPSYTVELNRVNPEHVDASVTKYLLFFVPVKKLTATDIIGFESKVVDGGLIRNGSASNTTGKITGEAEDHGLLLLKTAKGSQIEVYISPKNLDKVVDEINYFITESKEPSLRMWVTSNWKFGVILPGGIMLFGIAAFLSTVWAILTGQPLKKGGGTGLIRSVP
jgi:hypothetical protein